MCIVTLTDHIMPANQSRPLTVTLVGFGQGRPHADNVDSWLKKMGNEADEWELLDLLPKLEKDPASCVYRGERGDAPTTQRCVFGQIGFTAVIWWVIDQVINHKKTKWLISCWRGDHRSDVVCLALKEIFNWIEVAGRDGPLEVA